MHVTTHSYASGATLVTLRDQNGRGIESMNLSPFDFELYLALRTEMSDADAFRIVKEECQEAA